VGVVAGVVVAIASSSLVQRLADLASGARHTTVAAASAVPYFRLPAGREQAVLVLRAGPDGSGEQSLSRHLFPGETPERDLAAVLVANVSSEAAWDVDLEQLAPRFRVGESGDWEPFEHLAARLDDAPTDLSAADRLRLRGLGAGALRFTLEPRSARQVLLALPPDRQFEQVSDVQWGETVLRRDRADVERLRALRQDPSAAGAPR
jgi:hypothetical protein